MVEVTTTAKPEVKPTPLPSAKEKPVTPSPETKPRGQARATLEQIAKGTPVAEATTAPEVTINKDVSEKLLREANTLLLDLKDMRLLITAVATQAADTPLGREMRLDALRMIAKMSNADMPPEAVIKLDALQKQIAELRLPEQKPEQSALVQTIENYNATHQDQQIPAEVIDQIKSGKREVTSTIAQLIQTNTPFGQEVWKQVTGVAGFTKLSPTPEIILDLAGVEKTPDNLAKAQTIFSVAKTVKEPIDLVGKVLPGLMLGALGLMFVSQIAGSGETGGGTAVGGH